MKRFCNVLALTLLLFIGCKKEKAETYAIEPNESYIEWIGSSPSVQNTGTFSLTGRRLRINGGKHIRGHFEIPINSLNVTNLPPDLKQQLTNHLLSPDFFYAAMHPFARFTIKETRTFTGNHREGDIENANILVKGALTMLGVTQPIEFPARVTFSNGEITGEAKVRIDRTMWGMNYAADPEPGEHHISPLVHLHIYFVARKNQ